MNLEPARLEVDDPDLGNTTSRIERQLLVAVVGKRRVGHLDHEQHILGAGVAFGVEVVLAAKQAQIGKGQRARRKPDGILHPDDGSTAIGPGETVGQAVHDRGVLAADRRQFVHLAVEELNPFLRPQNAGSAHHLELFQAEFAGRDQVEEHTGAGGIRPSLSFPPPPTC